MMMPPKQDDLAARMDPSKQRARGFNTGKGAKGPSAQDDDSSTWSETPEQKQKRLQDEMMGVGKPAAPGPQPASKESVVASQTREQVVSDLRYLIVVLSILMVPSGEGTWPFIARETSKDYRPGGRR